MSIYEQLKAEALPEIESFQDDLLVHDRTAIEAWPTIPFLHYTRRSGTSIVFLPPADDECYPPYGAAVPYLFGVASREKILHDKHGVAKYFTDKYNPQSTCRYFNGKTLRTITCEAAVEIVRAYARPIEAKWHAEHLRNERPMEYKALRDSGKIDLLLGG